MSLNALAHICTQLLVWQPPWHQHQPLIPSVRAMCYLFSKPIAATTEHSLL